MNLKKEEGLSDCHCAKAATDNQGLKQPLPTVIISTAFGEAANTQAD